MKDKTDLNIDLGKSIENQLNNMSKKSLSNSEFKVFSESIEQNITNITHQILNLDQKTADMMSTKTNSINEPKVVRFD